MFITHTFEAVDIMPRSKTSDKVLCDEREGGGGGMGSCRRNEKGKKYYTDNCCEKFLK